MFCSGPRVSQVVSESYRNPSPYKEYGLTSWESSVWTSPERVNAYRTQIHCTLQPRPHAHMHVVVAPSSRSRIQAHIHIPVRSHRMSPWVGPSSRQSLLHRAKRYPAPTPFVLSTKSARRNDRTEEVQSFSAKRHDSLSQNAVMGPVARQG